jgi:hypothetical protein
MNFVDWEYLWATTPQDAKATVWRAHRIDEIIAGRAPRPLENTPTVVLHVFPTTSFVTKATLQHVQEQLLAGAAIPHAPQYATNADGILISTSDKHTYVQIFRDETLEYASSALIDIPGTEEFHTGTLRPFLCDFLATLTNAMGWPATERTYALAMLNVKGRRRLNATNGGFDRDHVLLPLITEKDPGRAAAALFRIGLEAAN